MAFFPTGWALYLWDVPFHPAKWLRWCYAWRDYRRQRKHQDSELGQRIRRRPGIFQSWSYRSFIGTVTKISGWCMHKDTTWAGMWPQEKTGRERNKMLITVCCQLYCFISHGPTRRPTRTRCSAASAPGAFSKMHQRSATTADVQRNGGSYQLRGKSCEGRMTKARLQKEAP